MKWCYLHTQLCRRAGPEEERLCVRFDYPIWITALHMLFCWAICGLWRKARRRNVSATAPTSIQNMKNSDESRIRGQTGASLSLRAQMRIVPLAALFAVSVGLGNVSLTYVYPSFSQMVSTTTPLITMLLHTLIGGARYNKWAHLTVPLLSGGFLLCTQHEQNYHVFGLTAAILAAVFRAAKSVVQSVLLSDENLDSVSLLFYMAPWSMAFLLLLSSFVEKAAPYTTFYKHGEVFAYAMCNAEVQWTCIQQNLLSLMELVKQQRS